MLRIFCFYLSDKSYKLELGKQALLITYNLLFQIF